MIGVLALSAGLAVLAVPGSAAASPACGSSVPSLTPTTADERTLAGYFEALGAGDYATAWSFFGDEVQSMYGSRQRYADLMAEHVGCVRLLGVTPFGAHTYRVDLAAEYPTPFPAGSGELPGFWTVEDGTITEFGTGP